MANPTKAFPIDPTGRILITEAADTRVATAQLQVGDTAVELTTNTTGMRRRKLFVRNAQASSANVIYIGDSAVSSSSGFPLYRWDEIELDVDRAAGVYAIAASGLQNDEVHDLEVE
jgi:hypothetical protein